VPEIRVDTIGDLAPRCAIYACCDSCRRSAKLNLVKLRMLYGPGLLLDDLKRCVTCSQCGRRTTEIRLVNSAK
jgi:bacterioferritin-associated ferredoxin